MPLLCKRTGHLHLQMSCLQKKGVPVANSWEKYLSANFAVTA